MYIYLAGNFGRELREIQTGLTRGGHQLHVDNCPLPGAYGRDDYPTNEDIGNVLGSDKFVLHLNGRGISTGHAIKLGAAIAGYKLQRKPEVIVIGNPDAFFGMDGLRVVENIYDLLEEQP